MPTFRQMIMDWLWIPLLLSGVGLVIGIRVYASRARKRAFREFAERFGFTRIKKPFSRKERKLLPLFHRGSSGSFSNTVVNATGAKLFDFQYKFGMPLVASVTYLQTVAAFPLAGSTLPDFQLAPATGIDKSAMALGLTGVKVEGNPEFSRKYLLRGSDRAALSALFSQLASGIEGIDPDGKLSIEKGGDWLIVYMHSRVALNGAIDSFWGWAQGVAEVFHQAKSIPVIS